VTLRLAIALTTAFAALGSLAATAAAGPAPFRVTEAGQGVFPERTYVLSLPAGERLKASRVSVSENGHGVVDLTVAPAAAPGASTGTVLAIDASNSMRGAPLTGAVRAARAFAGQRNVNQSLAILTFNRSAHVVLSFTKSQTAVRAALAHPPRLAFGTHLYNAVAQAVALVQTSGIANGSVIVLSDGADVGSELRLDQVIQNAKDAGVRVFTVGLRSKTFRPRPLQQLAESTGGSFSRADSPEALTSIYSRLGLQLAHEYLLTYHSIVEPGKPVKVTVAVAGIGRATSGYKAPPLPVLDAVFHHSSAYGIWQSWLMMLAISLLVPVMFAFAVVTVVPRSTSTVRARIADYVSTPNQQREGEAFVSRVFMGTERSLERTRWWQKFKDTLEFAEIAIPPVQVVVATLVLTVLAMWIFSLVAGPLFILGFAVPLVVRSLITAKIARKQRLFGDQLPDNLDVLASGLRAGYSLIAALAAVVQDAPEPSRSEFQRVLADEQLGIPLDDALGALAKRMRSRDMEQVALVAAVQTDTGGNAAEVLDRVTESIRERQELRRLVRSLTAQGRLARWIVSALPVGLLLMVSSINSTYMKPLFTHTSGKVMLAVAAMMIVSGSVVIGRIVDIKV
jgi:tight adherence protein B